MTNESRRAFDAEWLKYTPEDDKPMTKIIAEHFWQANEARILALLESEEVVDKIIDKIDEVGNASCQGEGRGIAKAVIKLLQNRE